MKILVTGASGQLGFDVCRELEKRKILHKGTYRTDFDLENEQETYQYIINYAPDVVIHCAAWTAVDKAEDEIEAATKINENGTRAIAKACKELGAKMIYISTDYVFNGTGEKPYEPNDETAPIGVYGKTKLAGENAVKELINKYFIVRISWVFGINGKNFVKTMLSLSETRNEISVVCDQIGSPTYTVDLAPLLCDMALSDKYGVYHATNEGVCSWAEFAEEIFRIKHKNIDVFHILTSEYPTRARRPLNSRLNTNKLVENGFAKLPHWKDALSRYLEEL